MGRLFTRRPGARRRGGAEEPRHAIRLVYSILFAYRHAVEVALKFIIDFYGDRDAAPRHGLRELWERARAIVEWSCFPDDADLRAFDSVIAELDQADRNSTAFRYAWPRRPLMEAELEADGHPLDREDVPLDLAVVADVMDRVEAFLNEMQGRLMDTGEDPRD